MQNSRLVSLLVKSVYLLTYLNQILYLGYFILLLLGKVNPPVGVRADEMFVLITLCIFAPLLCHFGLYCRDRFDLIRMCDGTSAVSRFIWTVLVLSMNWVLSNLFLRDFVQVY